MLTPVYLSQDTRGRKALLVSWRAGIPLQSYILGLIIHLYLQYIYAFWEIV